MATTNFRKTLIEIAKNEGNENKIAKIIAFNYPTLNITGRDALFESLMNTLERSDGQTFDFENLSDEIINDNVDVSAFQGRDYRIKEIEISNLRGIPSMEESGGFPYGINLIDEDGKVNNAIILANNGTGKSSIFAGLEMIYAQEIGEKNLRSMYPEANDLKGYQEYLKRVGSNDEPICNIQTINGEFNLVQKIFEDESLRSVFQPNSHFISEWDIIKNGRFAYNETENLDYSFHNIVAESLGLKEFLNLQSIANQIPSYRRNKETSARNVIEREIENNVLSIKNKTAEIQSKSIELKELKAGNTSNDNSQNSKIAILNNLNDKTFPINFDENNFRSSIAEFENKFSEYISKGKNKKAEVERNFLASGIELLHDRDDCPFCLSSKKSIDDIRTEVKSRLEELDEFQTLDKEIRDAFRKTSDALWNNTTDLVNGAEVLNLDREDLAAIPGLDEIRGETNRLYVALTHIVDDTELNDYVFSFTQKLIPTNQDYQNLFDLIAKNREIFEGRYIELAKEISLLIDKRKVAISEQIKLSTQNNTELTIDQKIHTLEVEIRDLLTGIATAEARNRDLEPPLRQATKKVDLVNQIKKEIEIFNTMLKVKIDELVKDGFIPIKETVEEILNDYFQDDSQYKLEIKLKESKSVIDGIEYNSNYIVAEIIKKSSGETISNPQNYFNAFRFKLFCLMISLSIALASRKMYKVNLPLVMDDMFFASDFMSKNSFSEFLIKIINIFYKHTPDMPLQFIIFTHDDMIFRSSIDATELFINQSEMLGLLEENQIDLIEKTIVGRFFNPTDKATAVSTFQNKNKYWELLYRIPKSIKELINL